MSSQAPTWRLLITPPAAAAWNMAVDEALLHCFPSEQQPTLRFYGWSPPALSLGIAQRWRDVQAAQCAAQGVAVVRRPTGGRAILHDRELTYSLVTSQTDPLVAAATVVGAYARINAALVVGLSGLGVAAVLAPRSSPNAPTSAACFDTPAAFEITVDGRKLVGSAQSRKHGAVLQQGTVLLHADPAALAALLVLPPALDAAALAQRLVALDEIMGHAPTFQVVAAALTAGFRTAWGITLTPGTLTEAEVVMADALVYDKYNNVLWTQRR